eukprot:210053_1
MPSQDPSLSPTEYQSSTLFPSVPPTDHPTAHPSVLPTMTSSGTHTQSTPYIDVPETTKTIQRSTRSVDEQDVPIHESTDIVLVWELVVIGLLLLIIVIVLVIVIGKMKEYKVQQKTMEISKQQDQTVDIEDQKDSQKYEEGVTKVAMVSTAGAMDDALQMYNAKEVLKGSAKATRGQKPVKVVNDDSHSDDLWGDCNQTTESTAK